MVQGVALELLCRLLFTEGSNPSLSVPSHQIHQCYWPKCIKKGYHFFFQRLDFFFIDFRFLIPNCCGMEKGKIAKTSIFFSVLSLTGIIFYDKQFIYFQTDPLTIYYLIDKSFILEWVKSQMFWQFLMGGWINIILNQNFGFLFIPRRNNILGFAAITRDIYYTAIN